MNDSSVTAQAGMRPGRRRVRRRRRLPPGQRLIVYCAIAWLLVLGQGGLLPAGSPDPACANSPPQVTVEEPFHLTEPVGPLFDRIKAESDQPQLTAGVFLVEPSSGRYASLRGRKRFPAASMIKVPVLVALLVSMDKEQVAADELLTLRPDLVAGGSGFLQWRPPGSRISLREAAELMITHSDNTATNLIIDRLGGKETLNKQFLSWGLANTEINNLLPDFDGSNKTSPYDLSFLLGKVDQGSLISAPSREFMYWSMERVRTRTLLPAGVGAGAKVVHKTGDIGKMVGDAGMVLLPDGRKYILAVQVERPHNDRRANQLVRDISKIVYESLVSGADPALVRLEQPPEKQPARKKRQRRR